MERITKGAVLGMYRDVQTRYPQNTAKGRINEDKIGSILEKPFFVVYGTEKYDTVYKKAACCIEGFVRFHPFSDGNKRMAILTAATLLAVNGHRWAIPIDAIRFLVEVAENLDGGEEEIDSLIERIAAWIEEGASTDSAGYAEKIKKYVSAPIGELRRATESPGGEDAVKKTLREWFAAGQNRGYTADIGAVIKFGADAEGRAQKELQG